MFTLALARSLLINLTVPGSHRTYLWASSSALQACARCRMSSVFRPMLVQNLIDLFDRIRFIPGTLVRQRLRQIFGLIFGKIVLNDYCKFGRKVFSVQTVFELFR